MIRKLIIINLSLLFPLILSAQMAQVSKKYHLEELEESINTKYDEAAPVISPDGKVLYFFVAKHPDNTFGDDSQDIWYSEMDANGNWSPAVHLDSPLNKNHGNQVFSVLNNGNTLFVRGTGKRDEVGFSLTHRSGRGWSSLEELKVEGFEEMNKNRFSGATLSSDMQHMILYFSENPRLLWSDLYYSKRLSGNKFSKPVKLPKNLNTGYDEFGPFLSPDDKVLYFASARKDLSIGGADLYASYRLDDTYMKWSDPVNLGAPISTPAFDGYISVDMEGNIYVSMAGKRIDGGNLNLYRVVPREIKMSLEGVVKEEQTGKFISAPVVITYEGKADTTLTSYQRDGSFRRTLVSEGKYTVKTNVPGFYPVEKSFLLKDVFEDTLVHVDLLLNPVAKDYIVKGKVYDSKTKELINGAEVRMGVNIDELTQTTTADKGVFSFNLNGGGDYHISANHSGYMEGTSAVNVNSEGGTFPAEVYLDPIEVGTTVVLKNIYFDFDKTTLKSESFVELDKVVNFLTDNGTLEIEISGHTDSKGTDSYNKDLSQGRAESVVQYLIEHGIQEYRLKAKGYGEEKPIATNDTDEGRAENRRVEFTVLAK